MSSIKINFILPGMVKSGGMKIILEYGQRLSNRGFDVRMYYPALNYHHFKGTFDYSFNLSNARDILKNILKRFLNIYGKLNFKIEVVPKISDIFIRDSNCTIATYWPTAYSVHSLSKSKGRKIYFIQDYEIWCNNIEMVDNSYRLPLERITISKYLSKILLDKFNAESTIILNGMDFSFYSNKNKDFRKEFKTITFIDYNLTKKNVTACVEVAKLIKNKFSKVKFNSFGLRKFNSMPDYVNFTQDPTSEKIKQIYCDSDIFLFTSTNEGFALPPAEAMACKCAVVTSAVGAVPEYSANDFSAMFIDPENIPGIVGVVSNLLLDNSKLEMISQNGSISVREKLNWENSLDKFEKIVLS